MTVPTARMRSSAIRRPYSIERIAPGTSRSSRPRSHSTTAAATMPA